MKEFINYSDSEQNSVVRSTSIPEEEYFLTSDGDGHDYIIPGNKKDNWERLQEMKYSNSYPSIDFTIDNEFGEYRVEGDWDKEYKIVKR